MDPGAAAPLLASTVSAGQVAVGLAYAAFILLWLYSELLACRQRERTLHADGKHDPEQQSLTNGQANGDAPPAAETVQVLPMTKSGFARCLQLDQKTLLENREYLKAGAEFGTILFWYYVADRTTVFPEMAKSYSRDVMGFIFLGLTLVAFATSLKKAKAPVLLNRQQTEEWKGWMQVLFLLYHYFEAREVYNAVRVFIAGYVWMTGYGNFLYYYKTRDFSFGRFCQMMWRLNFLVIMTCLVLQNSYMLYYICPMHTLFTIMVYGCLGIYSKANSSPAGILTKFALCFLTVYICWDIKAVFYGIWTPLSPIMGYIDPRRPSTDQMFEWYFRSSLDRYVWIHGMMIAYLHPSADAFLQRVDNMSFRSRWAIRGTLLAGVAGGFTLWYQLVYTLPKVEYNKVHPYTSWIPITLWCILRNLLPNMRTFSLSLFGWLGCITLETYISQFHTWLSTGIPNGQPKMLLAFFPPQYPLLNFAGVTAVYVYVSYRLFLLTNTLKSAVIPAKVGPLLWRNFAIFGLASAFLYITALLMVHIVPFTPLMSPILAPRTV